MKRSTFFFMSALSFLLFTSAFAQQKPGNFWSAGSNASVRQTGKRQIVPQKYLVYTLQGTALKDQLFSAPSEKTVNLSQSATVIYLPAPDGSLQRFRVVESPIMAEALASAYPQIKTFSIRGIDDPSASGKLDWNDFGFHGMVRSVKGDFFIDPYCVGNTEDYITYYTRDFVKSQADMAPEIGVSGQAEKKNKDAQPFKAVLRTMNASPAICAGQQLSIYRLAVACTGEYAIAATNLSSPTVQQTLAKIVTSVNRVDGVYETEVAVRMVLVATETLIVFTNPNTDPFTQNNNGSGLLGESQTIITDSITTPKFDIGHIFSTGGGGIAQLGCVCNASDKAMGVTGSSNPVGDPYDIDYVAHEMGHQFESNHPFNAITGSCGGGNRNASTAVEPGSGITIMGYAGICGTNDLAAHSIPYFHGISYDEIVNFVTSGGGSACPVVIQSNNQPPVVTGSGNFTIPASTPFLLTGSATDPDNDSLTYSWEEQDLGPGAGGNWNSGTAPYFRSYDPSTSPTRYFPNSAVVLSGNYTGTKGEYLPAKAQVLQFRLTARDNKMGGGGVCYAFNYVTIDSSGPLTVVVPSSAGIIWGINTQQTVTWDVNGTDQGPVSCANVNILVSYDSGNTYSVLVSATANDGVQQISVPNLSTTVSTCRIKVESVGNIFYDISNNDFTISTHATTPTAISSVSMNNPLAFAVWPNPAGGQLNISAANLNSQVITEVTLVDLLGRTVQQNNYVNKTELKENLDLSGINKGFYFVKISNNGNQAIYRILKD